jgi:hypothetical protein
MKRIYIIVLISMILLYGCSKQPSGENVLGSPTENPLTITGTKTITPQSASPTPEPSSTDLPDLSEQVTSTVDPELTNYSIAGVEAHNINDIQIIAQGGITWTRRNSLLWHLVEPVKGDRNWLAVESLESELIEASALGLKTILIVRGTPDWAQKVPGYNCGPVREDQLITMGDFIYDAVRRYSQPPYNIEYWELGNEPDVNVLSAKPNMQYGCWGDDSDVNFGGGYYAEMLKVVYPRIKSADPQAQVLIGGLLLDCDPVTPPEVQAGSGQYKDCKPATFLEGVLSNGGGEFFDGVAFHAYDYYLGNEGQYGNYNWHSSWDVTGPVLNAKVNYLRDLLERYGNDDKYLLNSEGALICGSTGKEPACTTESFNMTKASYLVQSYTTARALGLLANIWYDLNGWRGSGLVDNEGNPKPAFNALIFNTSIMKGADYVAEIQDYEGVVGFSFESTDSVIWLMWSSDGLNNIIKPDTPPDRLYDLFGSESSGYTEISIGYSPIYLVWDKSS